MWNFKLSQRPKNLIVIYAWVLLFFVVILSGLLLYSNKNVVWKQENSFSDLSQYAGIKDKYGNIAIYPMTMTIGMLVAILFSLYKFWRKNISITDLSIGIVFCIPASLFGASFFGKLNAEGIGQNANGANFIELFYFWNAGMAIHGGVYGGVIVGLIVYYFIGRRTKTSMLVYADATIPNILLGQAIGRWGNFFNHEVTGSPVGVVAHASEGSWGTINNIDWTKVEDNYLFLPKWITRNLLAEAKFNMDQFGIKQGDLVQLSPIFLYESLSLLAAWFIITFIIPNITKWISKKPWKIHPEIYKVNWTFSVTQWFMPWKKSSSEIKSSRDIWDFAYYKNVDEKMKAEYIKNLEINREKYLKPSEINKANKLYEYTSTKAGVEAFAYFFAWNIVRFYLELDRPNDHLFIMFHKDLSLAIIFISAFIGLVGMVVCQYVLPNLIRKNGYLYEKEYFSLN